MSTTTIFESTTVEYFPAVETVVETTVFPVTTVASVVPVVETAIFPVCGRPGRLRVHVAEGTPFHKEHHLHGSVKPYVVLIVGTHSTTTAATATAPTHSNRRHNAVWNQFVVLDIADANCEFLLLEVVDHNRLSSDKPLGASQPISLGPIQYNTPITMAVDIHSDKHIGQILLQMELLPL